MSELRVSLCLDRRSVARCLALLVAVAAVGVASAAGLRVSGSVEDESGKPVEGAEIVLTPVDESGQPTAAAVSRIRTNKKGKYVFGFATPGAYLVTATENDRQIVAATVRMRNADRKTVYGPDGAIEDRSGEVDPANPSVFVGIPRDAFYVEVDVTIGKPKVAAPAAAAAPGSIEQEILDSGLGKEVEAIVASIDAKQYEAALQETETLIAANPALAPLHYVKGFALVKLGRLSEAEAPLREALRLDPEIAGAAGLLGQALGEQGKYDEAVVALRQELQRQGESGPRASLLLGLGQALMETGKPEEAVAALEEALRIAPEDPDVRVQLIDAYTRSGRNEDAERLMGGDMDAGAAAILHYNVAANMLRSQKWEKAAEHLRKALELDPALHVCHKYLGESYLGLGKSDEAIKSFEAYLAAEPSASDAAETRKLIDALKKSR